MAKIDTNTASAAIIGSTATQFLSGKKSISRVFIKQAMTIGLTHSREASRILGVQEKQLGKAILLTCSQKELRPLVELIEARATARCRQTAHPV